MRKVGTFLAIAFCLAIMDMTAMGQGVFTSAATGNWNSTASWTFTGSDADGIPDADDDVIIQSTHTITVVNGATEACSNLTITGTSGTRLVIGTTAAATLEVYGTLNNNNQTPGANAIDCRNASGSKVVFRRTSDGALFSGSGSDGNMTAARYEVNLSNGVTGTSSGTIKAREFIITNGTWRHTSGDIRPDNGSADGGTLTIHSGGTLSLGNGTISRTTTSRTGTVTITSGGTLEIGGSAATIAAGTISFNGTVEYDAAGNQTLLTAAFSGASPSTYSNLRLAGSGTKTLGLNTTVNGTLTLAGTASLSLGAFTLTYGASSTLEYAGSSAQATTDAEFPSSGGPNGLTINNASGVTLHASRTINGTLALTLGDLTTGANILTQPGTATSTGAGDVIGNVKRTGFVAGGAALSFGNPFNSITFVVGGTLPSDVTVNLVKSAPAGFSNAVTRTYTITPTGGSDFSATVRLHYLDSELNGNTEATLKLFRFDGSSWTQISPTAADTTDNWVEASGVTTLSPWTIASNGPATASCTLMPASATNSVGTSHMVTATVTLSGAPQAGVMVNFNVTLGPNAGANGMATTNMDGQASFTYMSNGTPGTDTIEASGDISGGTFSCMATKTWIAAACLLSPPTATNFVGTNHTVTVSVTRDGNPASGIPVSFNVTMGPNAGASDSGTTDNNGQATFTYMSNGQTGADTIEASGDISGVMFSCTATKTWIAVPPMIINEVDSDTPGTDMAEFIELYDGGVGHTPLDGLVVVLYNGANDQSYAALDLDGFTTNASGYFLLGNAGVTPTPSIIFPDNFLQNGADAVALCIGNASDFPNGTSVTTTNLIDALVYDTDDPDDAGLLVLLNPGQSQVNENGGGNSANDSNQRCPNGSGGARNTNTYIQATPTPLAANNCPPPVCTLSPATATNPVATSHTVTVTVTLGGSPVSSVAVTFTVTMGPNAGVMGMGTTDTSGQASFTYMSNGTPGTDTIQASGSVNDTPFSCTATKMWEALMAACTLTPASATNPAGTSHTVTATITVGGSPVSGVDVTFTMTMGPNAGAMGMGTTDTSGQASFTYVSNGTPGTDTIQASGTVNGSQFSCTATKTWVATSVIINEVDSDTTGTDIMEFVELFDGGVGNTPLNGLVVVFYNGGDDKSYAAFDLDGFTTDVNGYFVLGNAAVPGVDLVFPDNTLQNGADAVALYIGNATDFPNGTSVTTTNLIDAMVYDTDDPDDSGLLVLLNPGQPQVNEGGGGNSANDSNQRCPNGSGGARTTSAYIPAPPTPGAPNMCPPPVGCSLAPMTATNPVGASHTVTVTVTQSGNPASGVMVTFSVTSGPSTGVSGSRTTDVNGHASFTYTSNGMTGTDTIQASGTVSDTPFSCMATKTWTAIPPVIINELDADNLDTDTMEFVELYDGGIGHTRLDGLVVVFYNGSNDQSYAAFDLDGFITDANGYFVLGNAAVPHVSLVFPDNTLQNGADAVALYVGNASNFPNGTPITTVNLIDALVYDTNDPDDPGLLVLLNPGQPQVDEGGGGNSAADSNQRCPNGAGGARNTNTYIQAEPTPGAANRCDVIYILQDDEITSDCLRLNVTTGMYTFKTTSDGPFTGPAVITQRGLTLTFQSGPSDPNLLQGGIDLGRRTGNARLQVPRGRRGRVFAINDNNIDNNGPCR